jgi:hypothetical protein
VVGAAFLVQVLTTGLQLAFGVMAAQIARHFSRQDSSAAASSLHMEAGQFVKKLFSLTTLQRPMSKVQQNIWRLEIRKNQISNLQRFDELFLRRSPDLFFNGFGRFVGRRRRRAAGVVNAACGYVYTLAVCLSVALLSTFSTTQS